MPKKTFKAVKKAKGELIVQVKGNQKELFREIKEACDYLKPLNSYSPSLEKSRNRIEKRTYAIFEIKGLLLESKIWRNYIDCVIRVERETELFDTRTKNWKLRKEVSYYVSSHRHNAKHFAKYIRHHWFSENCNHYVRDVALLEDASRIRTNAGVFARLRSFALNVLRFNEVKNIGEALFCNALDFDGLISLKGLID